MTQPFKNHPDSVGKYTVVLWFAFLSVLAGIAAYYRMFTGFNFYDDEGTLMVTVKQYLGGMKLYNQISLPYGPIYYYYNWAVRTVSRTPVTHNAVRMGSLIPWLLTALVSAWIVFRLTDSLVLATAAHYLTSLTLSAFFHNEPGHPQELCILLAVCLVASAIVISIPDRRLLGLILLGTLTTALLLVKVNIGTFAFLAASLALLAPFPKNKIFRFAFCAVAAASILLPVALMKAHLRDEPARMYALLVVISMIAVLTIIFRLSRPSFLNFRDVWIALASFAIALIGVVLSLKVNGIGLNTTLHALVLDSLTKFVNQGDWYVPLPADPRWLPWMVGGLAAAIIISREAPDKGQREDVVNYLKLALIVFAAIALYFGIPTYMFVLPFCWLVLFDPQHGVGLAATFPRALLCVFTILQALYAYPIAGSQMSFIQVLPIIVALTCLGDVLQWQEERLSVIPRVLMRTATWVLLLCVAASYLVIAHNERKFYDSLPSLLLPGAERIHLYPAQARDYRWLVQNLNDHCDIFFGSSGASELTHLDRKRSIAWFGHRRLDVNGIQRTTDRRIRGSFSTPQCLRDLQFRSCGFLEPKPPKPGFSSASPLPP